MSNEPVMSNFYIDLTPTAFRKKMAEAPIAYLPLGTLEWHSEHLPLGTDGIISSGFFNALASRVGGIVLPMLFLGPDRVKEGTDPPLIGMDFCTIPKNDLAWYADRQLEGSAYWVPNEEFASILRSTFRQLARAGFKIIVAHGHGPSSHLYAEGIPQWEKEFGLKCFTCLGKNAADLGIQTDHAAVNETSLVMALRPDLVDMSALSTDPAEFPIGVWGDDPRGVANAEIGERAIRATTERMVAVLRDALASL